MKMFSDCSGECCVCACGGGCLAGHGDDDFWPASTDQIIDRLNKNQYPDYTNTMVAELRRRGVEYIMENLGSVHYETPKPPPLPTDEEVDALFANVFGK